jgi:hypothetical protein
MKGAKIGSVILGLLFLAFRFGAIKLIVIQEGETGLIVKRGNVKLDKKTGLPKLVNPKWYQLHVAVYRHIAIVSNRERTLHLGSLPVTIGSETWVAPLELVWSIKGDPVSMHDALIKVSDGNRFDEKFGALEAMIKAQVIAALAPVYEEARLTENGTPTVNYRCVRKNVRSSLRNYGCKYHQLLPHPMHRYSEQHTKDGQLAIASAIKALTPVVALSDEGGDHPRLASA